MSSAIRAALLTALLIGCGDGDGATVDGGELDAEVADGPDVDAAAIDAATIDAIELDAPTDVAVDAPLGPTTPFELAYANAWSFRGITGVIAQSTALVINPGTNLEALDLSTFFVASVVDDHPVATIRVLIPVAAAAPLPVGNAAGNLSSAAETHIGPLVTEPRFDSDTPAIGFSISDLPMPVNTLINATAVLRNGTQQVTLSFVFTLHATGAGAAVTGASRVASGPLM